MKNIPASSSQAVVQQLSSLCELAHDVLKTSLEQGSGGARPLKRQLLHHHEKHVAQLRSLLGVTRRSSRHSVKRPGSWSEVVATMDAQDDYVAFAACLLLERVVLATYDRALERAWLDGSAKRLIHRQRTELRRCMDMQLRKRPGTRERIAETTFAFNVSPELGRTASDGSGSPR